MKKPTDAITKQKRSRANSETVKIDRSLTRFLNRGTEGEFAKALSQWRPDLSPEEFQKIMQLFRDHRRS